MECSVLDLPNVVAGAPTDTTVKYVAGDMFESVLSADTVFLKVRTAIYVVVVVVTYMATSRWEQKGQ